MDNIILRLTSMIAEKMTDDDICTFMEDAIMKYRTQNDFSDIRTACSMIVQRDMVIKFGSVEKTLEMIEGFAQIKTAFDHTQNKS